METQHSSINPQMQPTPPKTPHPSDRSGRILGGAVIVAVGLVLLAKQAGVLFPWWFFSWEMILIVIGLFIGAWNSFRDWGWIIPVAIGVFFLADDVFPDLYYLRRYFWPVIIIIIGLAIMFKSRRKISYESWTPASTGTRNDEDLLDSVTIFGGVKKNIISKDFRGGESVTVFGGTELNLLQADIQDRIVLELVQVFGGTKLIVPAHWRIQSDELVSIFGGLNDKRPLPAQPVETTKVIILKGTCIFGGIDIKSY